MDLCTRHILATVSPDEDERLSQSPTLEAASSLFGWQGSHRYQQVNSGTSSEPQKLFLQMYYEPQNNNTRMCLIQCTEPDDENAERTFVDLPVLDSMQDVINLCRILKIPCEVQHASPEASPA